MSIKWHNIILPKNKIFIYKPMINGNKDCEICCGLDRNHSLEGSKDGRNAMVYCLKSSDNFWVSLLLFFLFHSFFLSLSLSLSLSHASLCRPTRAVWNAYILHGRVAHRIQFPSCDNVESGQRWNETGVPIQSQTQAAIVYNLYLK
jgi:hypothetical protein